MKTRTPRNLKMDNENISDEKANKGALIAAALNSAICAHAEAIAKYDADKRADAEVPKEEKKVEEAKADDSGEQLNKVLSMLDSVCKKFDSLNGRMDAMETDDAKRRKDAEEKEFKERGDPEEMKVDSRADSTENLNAIAEIQLRADQASSAWGNRIPTPWTHEGSEDYLRRTALLHKSHSPNWKDVDLRELKGKSLQNAAEQIFSDSETASRSGDCAGVGRLRMVVKRNPDTGHIVREYFGDPAAWMERFSGGRRLAKFNLKSNGG
jgi:hypothetical protein